MILFRQYCALDAAACKEMRKGCHLIVNSLNARVTTSLPGFEQRVSGQLAHEALYLSLPFAHDLLQLYVKLLYLIVIPHFHTNIFSDPTVSGHSPSRWVGTSD
jgi:hypothetical protein